MRARPPADVQPQPERAAPLLARLVTARWLLARLRRSPSEDERVRRYRGVTAAMDVNEDGGGDGPVQGMRRP